MPCTKFKSNGTIIDDGIDITNKVNNFFVNVSNTLAKSIPTSHKHPNYYISYNASNTFSIEPVSENEIWKIIGTFKDSAAGWDGIKPGIVKHIKEIVCIPLKHICDMSFQFGIFLLNWKLQMWCLYSKQVMKWYFLIIGLYLCYLCFPNCWND